MDKYDFNVAIWKDSENNEWLYSVIQECDGEVELLCYGSNYDPAAARRAISQCISEMEF